MAPLTTVQRNARNHTEKGFFMCLQRDSKGRFAAGNTLAAGHKNPLARKRQALTDEFLEQLTPARYMRIVRRLLIMAEGGDMVAIKEVMDRALGRTKVIDDNDPNDLEINVIFPPELQNI